MKGKVNNEVSDLDKNIELRSEFEKINRKLDLIMKHLDIKNASQMF
jgi:hypothetical protein